jgi:hypothetical protein
MNLQEIKEAVLAGNTVHWKRDNYRVTALVNGLDQVVGWLIKNDHNESCISLTWTDDVTLIGKEEDYYVRASSEERLMYLEQVILDASAELIAIASKLDEAYGDYDSEHAGIKETAWAMKHAVTSRRS